MVTWNRKRYWCLKERHSSAIDRELIKIKFALQVSSGQKIYQNCEKNSGSFIKLKTGDHSLGSACAEVCPEAAPSPADDLVPRYFDTDPMRTPPPPLRTQLRVDPLQTDYLSNFERLSWFRSHFLFNFPKKIKRFLVYIIEQDLSNDNLLMSLQSEMTPWCPGLV